MYAELQEPWVSPGLAASQRGWGKFRTGFLLRPPGLLDAGRSLGPTLFLGHHVYRFVTGFFPHCDRAHSDAEDVLPIIPLSLTTVFVPAFAAGVQDASVFSASSRSFAGDGFGIRECVRDVVPRRTVVR